MTKLKGMGGAEKELPRNAHDALFKDIFGNPQNAAAALRAVLPAHVSRHVDWPTLSLVQASVVGQGLWQRHGDLLFDARLHRSGPLYIWLMFEHQSTADFDMPLRIQTNTTGLWKRYRQQHKKPAPLPPVLPVVLYNGQKRWSAPTSLVEMMSLPDQMRADLEPYLPSCRFVLDDLGLEESEGLANRALPPAALLGLIAMKYARHKEVVDRLVEQAWAFRALLKDEAGRDVVRHLLGYVLRENKKLSVDDLMDPLKATIPREERSTMQSHKEFLDQLFEDAAWKSLTKKRQREMQRQLKEKVLQEIRQEVQEEVRQEIQEEIRQEVQKEIQEEIRQEIQEEIRQEIQEEIRQEVQEEIRQEIKEEVMREGMQKALQQTLTAQIRQRFGRLPRAAATRIRAAHSNELSTWLQRILQVNSVEELFADSD